ncbi:MAG: YicC family protein [bacterium]|nr:YicC family protein [bacterium]
MAASMTGFGRAEIEQNGYRASVEVKSVNGRYGDVSVHLPRSVAELEPRIKELVLQTVSRGHVSVSVGLKGEAADRGIPVLNEDVLNAYRRGLDTLCAELRSNESLNPAQVAMLPGMFEFEAQVPDLDAVWAAVEPACQTAVAGCQAMRLDEGKKLVREMVGRIEALDVLVEKVESRAPERVQAVQQRLQEKLQELVGSQMDETRLVMEVALLAERYDITEETVRFRSHTTQFFQTVDSGEAVGRRLNFLLQEMLREVNTIGSKANDAAIAHLAVEMKEEIEKLKEQVQNIE